MSRYSGDIRQIAFVVKDADATMNHLARTLGVGPFVVRRDVSFDKYQYMGQPSESPILTLGLAQSGLLQFEVIQQHNDAPSAYRDFIANRPEGFQHCCSWFESREEFLMAYNRLLYEGLECVHEGYGRGFDVRFAYFRSPSDPYAPHLEIAEALVPQVRGWVDKLQKLAATWDGKDPLREANFVHPVA